MTENNDSVLQTMAKKRKEVVFGGCEYRNNYEQSAGKKDRMLRFCLTVSLIILALAAFLIGSFGLISRLSTQIREKVTSESDEEPALYDASEIRSPFVSAQSSIQFEEIDEEEANLYSIPVGVRIRSVSSQSEEYAKGFREGDIIVMVNDCPVRDIGDMYELFGRCSAGESAVYRIFRENSYFDVSLVIPRW